MTLLWTTDKPIGKYRLRKPIPVEGEGLYSDSKMFNVHFYYPTDGEVIWGIEAILNDEEDSDYVMADKEERKKFRDDIKEYLEE